MTFCSQKKAVVETIPALQRQLVMDTDLMEIFTIFNKMCNAVVVCLFVFSAKINCTSHNFL
jgi:hypothetical protein